MKSRTHSITPQDSILKGKHSKQQSMDKPSQLPTPLPEVRLTTNEGNKQPPQMLEIYTERLLNKTASRSKNRQ